jgi:hypothetical protein
LISHLIKTLGVTVLIASLIAGVGLRVVQLDQVPPGTYSDEACNGYDAYCILRTGRDHHGNFLPLLFQGLNDYRMPLFNYSLVPLIAVGGLKVSVVRLGAAIWGIADVIAAVTIAGLIIGPPGAIITALLLALSPWLLPLNRYGIEASTTSALATLSVLCFLFLLKRKEGRFLPLSGVAFGIALYSGSIAKGFIPLLMGLLAMVFWREVWRVRRKAILALGIFVALGVPQAVVLIEHPDEVRAHFSELSLFHYMSTCPACPPSEQQKAGQLNSPMQVAENLGASWLGYFNPEFLFLSGDPGGHWELLFPPGFGLLLPEQALLIGFAIFAALAGRRRRLVVLLLGWLVLAAVPASILVPAGAWMPEGGDPNLPTPIVSLGMMQPNTALTPAILFSHPEARHDLFAIVPWILLSAVGFVALTEYSSNRHALRMVMVGLTVLGIVFHGVRFVSSYFHEYPISAAPYFYWGLDDAIGTAVRFDPRDTPIVISDRIEQAYIQVLFDEHYPPALLQREGLVYRKDDYPLPRHPHAQPIAFGRYVFEDWQTAWQKALSDHTPAIFIVPGRHSMLEYGAGGRLSAIPHPRLVRLISLDYPNGEVAYQVLMTDGGAQHHAPASH